MNWVLVRWYIERYLSIPPSADVPDTNVTVDIAGFQLTVGSLSIALHVSRAPFNPPKATLWIGIQVLDSPAFASKFQE